MVDKLKAGQQIEVTIKEAPRREADRKTIARLMRFDPDIKRALTKAQNHRMKTLVVRSRGRRPWAVRVKSARIARVETGASWKMTYFPHVAPEFRSVEKFLTVKA